MFVLTLLTVLTAVGGFLEPVLALLALALENPQAVGVLLGLLVPVFVDVLKQPGLSPGKQRALAYAFSGIVGLLTVISFGQFNAADLIGTLVLTVTASQAAYAEFWKPTGASASVQAATTPKRLRT